MERSKEEVQRELKSPEKPSGSKDPQNFEDDPEASHPPKGKRGAARGPKPRHVKQTEREVRQEIETGFQQIEESRLNSADVNAWLKKKLKTVVK